MPHFNSLYFTHYEKDGGVMKRREAAAKGLLKYNTGKPCGHGHFCDRYTKTGQCIDCLLLWKSQNKSKVAIYKKTYTSSENGRRNSRKRSLEAYYRKVASGDRPNKSKSAKESKRKWKLQNKSAACDYAAKRRSYKINATPLWFESEKVSKVYKMAAMYGFEVDHVVPLVSERVSGLHCWHNLQLLDGKINASKGNRHWPHMPN